MKQIDIFSDGGARGNPGPAAFGFVIKEAERTIFETGHTLGVSTNNVAEYTGVLEALKWVEKNIPDEILSIHVFVDSELICRQLSGIYRVKNEGLKELFTRVKVAETKLKTQVEYSHVPREENRRADFLVNQALDNNL